MVKEFGSSFETAIIPTDTDKGVLDSHNRLYLRSAREGLYIIGLELLEKGIKRILMPALCCRSMVQAFLQLDFEVEYFRITEALTIDISSIVELVKDNSALLVMHYHGIKGFQLSEIRKAISGFSNIEIIQDCTQHIFSQSLYEEAVNYRIGSLRKWLAMPDGAFVEKVDSCFNEHRIEKADNEFIDNIVKSMDLKKEYLQTGKLDLKATYRELYAWGMNYLKGTIVPHSMSSCSRKILAKTDIDEIRRSRRSNYNTLLEQIKCASIIKRYASDQESPLCFVIIVNEQSEVQKLLSSQGVFCQVLWPIPEEAEVACQTSKAFTEHMLAVPCDQRYSVEDMRYIAAHLNRIAAVAEV